MQEQLIEASLAKFARHGEFEVLEELPECAHSFKVFKLNYYQDEGLHTLEAFAEGSFRIGPLRVERKYINSGCTPEEKQKGGDNKFTYYTKVVNTLTEGNPPGQVGMVHGFSEESDIWLEPAYQLALNGFIVHIIDNDAYGLSSGTRGTGPNVVSFHHNVSAMLQEFHEGVPAFLYGNSMGCMIINTFLLSNPDLKLQGVIFGSPFFEMAEHMGVDAKKKLLARTIAPLAEGFALIGSVNVHRVSTQRDYTRKVLTQRKSVPIIGIAGLVNMLNAIDNMQNNAHRFNYPFMLMQGSLDSIVSNAGALRMYNNSKKVSVKEKVLFQGFCHELHKEPGKEKVYKHVLSYLSRRISESNVVTWSKPKQLKQGLFGQTAPCPFRRALKWLAILYLLIGIVFWIIKRKRGLLLKWPRALLKK